MSTMLTETQETHFEMIVGIVIALFTALFAINNLAGGIYGANELIAHNEKAAALAWHNSKSIKQTLIEGEVNTLNSLLSAETLRPEVTSSMEDQITLLKADIDRYDLEKNEILQGSAHIPQEQWTQDINGELGKVIGANEHTLIAEENANAGGFTDMATLYFELCLVIGGISLLFQRPRLKWLFFGITLFGGVMGTAHTIIALTKLWPFS